MENIKAEIIKLVENYSVKKIYLMDDNFVPKSKAVELFNLISEIKKTLGYSSLDIVIQNMAVNNTDFEIIDSIALAGIKYIPLAIESGSKEIQKKIRKSVDLDKAFKLVKYAKSKDIKIRCFYIIGFPNETVEQMRQTIDFAIELKADWSTFSVALPLVGSQMYDDFISLGYIKDAPEFWNAATIRNRIFDTPEIKADDIMDMAYSANLEINFIHNCDIKDEKYDEAEIIFENFTKSFPFHIFAFDALRRIQKAKKDLKKEQKYLEMMLKLVNTDIRAKELMKYAYLFDSEASSYLNK
jgi:hypothetical protein